LSKEPLHIDQLIADTNLPAGAANAGVVSLRLKGLIKQLPGNLFTKR
jgi:predicted Rossmann fold nucleotide-binding protein DprA/Smf involved in DNA uptake